MSVNRWALRESGDVTFYRLVTGKPLVTLRTGKTASLQVTGETVYARGFRQPFKTEMF